MKKRFIKLNETQRTELDTGYRRGKGDGFRNRCRMVLLCDQGYEVESLANIFGTTRQAIYRWFDRYETGGIEGLRTKVRSGCPPKLEVSNAGTVSTVKRLLEEEPRNLNLVLARIEQELGEKLSSRTLSRFLKRLVTDGSASATG